MSCIWAHKRLRQKEKDREKQKDRRRERQTGREDKIERRKQLDVVVDGTRERIEKSSPIKLFLTMMSMFIMLINGKYVNQNQRTNCN